MLKRLKALVTKFFIRKTLIYEIQGSTTQPTVYFDLGPIELRPNEKLTVHIESL